MGSFGDEMMVSGLDEAGRGCLVGNLFLAIVEADNETIEKFKEGGVKDSKLLSSEKRGELAVKIKENSTWAIASLDPQEIDGRFDCPSTNITAFTAKVKSYLETDTILVLEHKADLNHVIVGAASILAKEEREKHIKLLSEMCGVNLGSGYPADPIAMKGAKKLIGTEFDLYLRKSWATYSKMVENKEQKKLGDYK